MGCCTIRINKISGIESVNILMLLNTILLNIFMLLNAILITFHLIIYKHNAARCRKTPIFLIVNVDKTNLRRYRQLFCGGLFLQNLMGFWLRFGGKTSWSAGKHCISLIKTSWSTGKHCISLIKKCFVTFRRFFFKP